MTDHQRLRDEEQRHGQNPQQYMGWSGFDSGPEKIGNHHHEYASENQVNETEFLAQSFTRIFCGVSDGAGFQPGNRGQERDAPSRDAGKASANQSGQKSRCKVVIRNGGRRKLKICDLGINKLKPTVYEQPPAMEGTSKTLSPSLTVQASPPRKRMSSSLR